MGFSCGFPEEKKMSTPKPTFKIKQGDFEGCIGNLKNFRKLDVVARADLLQDWIVELGDEYQLTLDEMAFTKLKLVGKS
jgi:hypothetical protein